MLSDTGNLHVGGEATQRLGVPDDEAVPEVIFNTARVPVVMVRHEQHTVVTAERATQADA